MAQIAKAQPYSIAGKVADAKDQTPLTGVTVTVAPITDTAKKTGSVTDPDGNFSIENLNAGKYLLKISYIGFEPYTRMLNMTSNTNIGTIGLKANSSALKNVTVTEKQKRVEQLGDTTQFNANAYKTNPDANTDDLLQKMPGVTTEQGKLKVNGEEVKQVLVDGKPFFGDDPAAVIKTCQPKW